MCCRCCAYGITFGVYDGVAVVVDIVTHVVITNYVVCECGVVNHVRGCGDVDNVDVALCEGVVIVWLPFAIMSMWLQ